jgi:hypothetical protein
MNFKDDVKETVIKKKKKKKKKTMDNKIGVIEEKKTLGS